MSDHRPVISLDLTKRVSLAQYPELMDQPCSLDDLRGCLQDIARVNSLLHGHRPTFHWLNHVYAVIPWQKNPVHIVDIGCGYGDALRQIHRWAQDRNLPVVLTGIDLNPETIQVARAATAPGIITYLAGDVHDFHPPGGIDLVISSLVMHHLETRQIVDLLEWMESTARLGWFVNDLHRQAFPYYAFRWLARVMPWHRFVNHDGAVSILRSFRRADWLEMLAAAAIPQGSFLISEYRPARLCVARLKEAASRR